MHLAMETSDEASGYLDSKLYTFTFVLCFLYLCVMLFAVVQVVRIAYYKHNMKSYQFAFLLLCMMWALLRALYFLMVTPSNQESGWLMVIFWTPLNIQFATFTLLVCYYASLVHKNWKKSGWKLAFLLYVWFNGVFLISVSVFVALSLLYQPQPEWLVGCTQGFSGVIFFLLVVVLGFYAVMVSFKIRTSKITKPVHFRGSSTNVVVWTFIIVGIYISRSAYDIVTIFGYWRLDYGDTLQNAIIFGLYCLWELAPVVIVLILFNRIPKTRLGRLDQSRTIKAGESPSLQRLPQTAWGAANAPSVFDDPQRYESEDEAEGDRTTARLISDSSSGSAAGGGGNGPGGYGANGSYAGGYSGLSHMPYKTTPVYATTPTSRV